MPKQLTFQQAFPFVKATLETSQTPALMGDPGIGKSSFAEDLAREFKTEVFTLPVNQLADRADLTGVRMVKSEDTGKYRQEAFPHSTIMDAIEYAEKYPDERPILFLDEFNRASPDITSAILSFQTLRRVGTIDFPDNLRFIVAGNDKGNVTNLDKASISRFTVYNVKPDLETFMSIQKLNPFVNDVLSKYPEDLTAGKSVLRAETDQDDDDEDDDSEANIFADLEGASDELFEQITAPRTISALSDWLNKVGFDKSGSDKERELLGAMFSDMADDESNVLLAAIEGHVGSTTFAHHLFEDMQAYFNTLISAGHTVGQPVLLALRPTQTVINAMSRAADTADIETLVQSMNEADLSDATIWLMENQSTKEINNNSAVEAFIQTALHSISAFDNKAVQNMMTVLPDSAKVSKIAVNAMLASSAPVMAQYAPVIKSITDQN